MENTKDYIDIVTPYGKEWKEDISQVVSNIIENKDQKTCLSCLIENATKDPNRPFLAWRPGKGEPYTWMTRGEAMTKVFKIGAGLETLFEQLGVSTDSAGEQARVGIFSPNCPDWNLSENAAFSRNIVTVPMYPTCGEGTLDAIIRHAELSTVFCYFSSMKTLLGDLAFGVQRIKNAAPAAETDNLKPPLKTIVLIGNDTKEETLRKIASEWSDNLDGDLKEVLGTNFRVMTLNDLILLGENAGKKGEVVNKSTPSSIHSIIYTSGSEGRPKGVILTHQQTFYTTNLFEWYPDWRGHFDEYIYFSYLPLAHSFEREVYTFFAMMGSRIAYCSGIPFLADDMREIRPHVMMGVPRIWKRLYDTIQTAINSLPFYKRWPLQYAISRKIACESVGAEPWVDWDMLGVSALARAALGGNLKVVISGAAAVDPMLVSWFSAVFGCKFFQGYGLSETFGAVTVQHTGGVGADKGTIGAPVPGIEIRLKSVPDMGYLATANPPCGEICIRGPSIMTGYFKDDELTREVIDDDRFFATGDIGRLNPDHTLSIIDRKKSNNNNYFILLCYLCFYVCLLLFYFYVCLLLFLHFYACLLLFYFYVCL